MSGYVERTVPVCPVCENLARRNLGEMTARGREYGPWRCDLHGEVQAIYITYDVPTGEEAYELSDPKHPQHHEVFADIADREDFDR